ncbi:MAG: alanyl-tRNA editing protein AlaX [Candidatus Nanohalarchaeota archaeon]|nr:MAG: alanyl-tRNA editing protein AlaX [Candidatus Nanohaloarchaeota archaeon]
MNLLYMDDSYLKKFSARVVSVSDGKFVVLDKTAFYPNSGGQLHDTGVISRGADEFLVVFVGKFSGEISHEVSREGLEAGDEVECAVDWDRRYKMMRAHTAAHIISGIIHEKTGAQITGNQLGCEKSRIDFNVRGFDKGLMASYEIMVNNVVCQSLPVTIKTLARDEAFKIPFISKLKMQLPESIKELRIVDIEGFDMQACAGTHVRNTSEIGKVKLVKTENKGKNSKRLYFEVLDR